MAFLQIKNLSFRYPQASKKALKDLSVNIAEGEFVLICGASGSGKTTFLQQLKREIRPVGEREGEIRFRQTSFDTLSPSEVIAEIGFVFQDPDNQIVMDSVEQELAFSLENMGFSQGEMRKRMGEMVHFFGMETWLHRPLEELSGGEKQLVNLASVLLLRPKILLLDEPTAQLDPVAAKDFLQLVGRINEEFSTTIIMTEHRLEEVFPMASQVLLMDEGEIAYQGEPRLVCQAVWSAGDQEWLAYLPALSRLYLTSQECRNDLPQQTHSHNMLESLACVHRERIPLTVKEGKEWLRRERVQLRPDREEIRSERGLASNLLSVEPILRCRDISFQYVRGERKILQHVDFHIEQGEFFSIMGGNGSGKSTLLKVMLGLLKPQQGKVFYKHKSVHKIAEQKRWRYLGYVDQNPKLYFTYATVQECLQKRVEQLEQSYMEQESKQWKEPKQVLDQVLDQLHLSKACLPQHPYDLSGGEQQKLALAMVLLAQPDIVLVDEPTKGLDPHSQLMLGQILQEWQEEGLTVIMVSHDLEFVAEYASRCALLFAGEIMGMGSPKEFFSDNYFYTTAVQRVFREELPGAITYRDVIERWG